jgi:hypothetical protein
MSLLQLQQQNVAATTAFTEVTCKVPPRVNEVTVSLRKNDTLYWYVATTNGTTPGSISNLPQSPNTYGTIPPGSSRTIRGLLGAQTVYFQVATSQVAQVIEVDYYGDV